MKIEFYGKNIEITESMEAFVTKKAKALDRFVKDEEATLRITAEVIKGEQIATMLLEDSGKVYSALSQSTDFYDASLATLEKLKKQLEEAKSKNLSKKLSEKPLYQFSEPVEEEPEKPESDCLCSFYYTNAKTGEEGQLDVDIDKDDKGWLRNAYDEWLSFCNAMGMSEDSLRNVEIFGIEEDEDFDCEAKW